MILIVANREDLHARNVAMHLDDLGEESLIWDPAALSHGESLSFTISSSPPRWWLTVDGKRRPLDTIRAAWLRRLALPRVPRDVLGREDRRFISSEWSQALDSVVATLDIPCVSPLRCQRNATKPRQLAAARTAGLRVPATLVTSDPAAAREFVDVHDGRVVVKAMSPHRTTPMYTSLWDARAEEHADLLRIAPAMFQEEMPGTHDLRVIVVGATCFGAWTELHSGVVDGRLQLDEPWLAVDLDGDLERRLIRMMGELGLSFGCVDLRITAEGEPVFFEVNPQGQFLYIEIWTGQPISRAVAELLRSQGADE